MKFERGFACYHMGCEYELSQVLKDAIDEGVIYLNGFIICDAMVPLLLEDLDGQNITCVGPNHPNCPHPNEVKIA